MRRAIYGRAIFGIAAGLFALTPCMGSAQQKMRTVTGERAYSFYGRGPYRAHVPRPSAILGYEAGETHTTFRDQERALLAIADAAKDRVAILSYGRSAEGRPLRIVAITAPENLKRLDALRLQNLKLADPRKIENPKEEAKLLQTTPAITWINHCIHGDETASFEAFLWTFYTLAASDSQEVKQTLQNSIVILNPVFNPDGHERYVVYYNSLALGNPDDWAWEQDQPATVWGRLNHYRFDMNRDKLAQSQDEVRQEIAAYTRWFPHLYVDQHGQVDNYFFPPNPEAIHALTDVSRLNRWTDRIGRANAQVFDSYGWQHVTKQDFDLFYPGYLDSWATFSGAIGMTYETDGGRVLARRRQDGTVSTLGGAVARHVETALATIFTGAQRKTELLADFLAYRKGAIEAGKMGKMRRIAILPGTETGRASELAAILVRSGIEVHETKSVFSAEAATPYLSEKAGKPAPEKREFPAGTLLIDIAQPQGKLALALLEPDPEFNRDFVKEQHDRRKRNEKRNENERREGYAFYDITAWALPYSFGLEAYWLEETRNVEKRLVTLDALGNARLSGTKGGVIGGDSSVAYLIPYRSDASAVLALRLQQEGFRLAAALRPIVADGKKTEQGTFVARVNRNPPNLKERLEALGKELGVEAIAVKSSYAGDAGEGLGSDAVTSLFAPSVAVISGDSANISSFGAVWHLLEKRAGVRFSAVTVDRLNATDLSRFNVILFPDGFGYQNALGKQGIERLKEWVKKGGALIGLEGGGAWFSEKEAGFASVSVVGEGEKRKPTSLPGAFFRAKIDATHFLGFGFAKETLAAPLMGSVFLKPTAKGTNVISFPKGEKRLSGFVWENNTEELLSETVYLVDEPMGRGHAILFLNDPTFRGLWAGQRRLLYNALLFAPSFAAMTEP